MTPIADSIGITATRVGLRSPQLDKLRELLTGLRPQFTTFRHGDCVGGDAEAHDIAVGLGYRVVIHPPADPRLRAGRKGDFVLDPLPYLTRNRAIVDSSALLIGCPDGPERVRSGTWSTIRYARRLGVRVLVIEPSGRLT